jgi:peptidyl-prolyl cis-trans isomerase C
MRIHWIKDPLIHFLVVGALLFGAYFWWEGNNPEEKDNRIVIEQADLDHLISLWKLQWKQGPSPSDVEAILDRHIRQEVFYREALKMNLDHNDQIIRNRLAQKMEAVANDLSLLMNPPTDERLRDYFHRHEAFFTLPPAYAFQQVLFSSNEQQLEAHIEAMLARLRQGDSIPRERQNKLALPSVWPLTSEDEIQHAFGGRFVEELAQQSSGQWVGPIASGYGWHLVLIEDRQRARVPAFEDVRDYVAREYEYQAVLDAQNEVYEKLRGNYEVIVTAEIPSVEIRAELAKK